MHVSDQHLWAHSLETMLVSWTRGSTWFQWEYCTAKKLDIEIINPEESTSQLALVYGTA